ncbi:MAG: NADH:flavin oxidoreductase [Planctomycetes bacterium]|nr:NADH:flavin oxidoreductase [Planctomycetota bacterium]
MTSPGSERGPRHDLPAARWPDREEATRSLLFSPAPLGRKLVAATRSWVPAMVPWRATEDGLVTDRNVDWYGRFADGRPGVLVVEATGIRDVPSGPLLRIGHDRFIPGLRRLVTEVRRRSAGETRILIQLIDFLGIRRRPRPETFFDRYLVVDQALRQRAAERLGDPDFLRLDEATLRARLAALDEDRLASVLGAREFESLRMGHRERVTDLHLDHVRALPRTLPGLFAAAAARAREAGFDGVELHYAHAYTMASFLSRLNDRSDGYGGSPEGRLRLPLEVFAAVRERVGDDFPVGCRYLGDEVIAGGSRIEDALHYGEAFAAAGMDFLSISKGGKFEDARQPAIGEAAYPYTGPSGQECMPTVRIDERGPFGRNVALAAAIRAALRAAGHATPVVTAGGIATFDLAERILREGSADFVGAARQSLADPDWWRLMAEGRGAEIRRCEFTNYCEGLDQKHKEVTCRLWDRLDLEAAGQLSADGRRRLLPPRR